MDIFVKSGWDLRFFLDMKLYKSIFLSFYLKNEQINKIFSTL